MTGLRIASRIVVLLTVAVACGRSSKVPIAERGATHCQRDLVKSRVCLTRPETGPHVGDSDRDGIYNAYDCCPKLPEDHDGFEDRDGCPDCDNDQDGILDAEWLLVSGREYRWSSAEGWWQKDMSCQDLAEDFDGVDDEDGCPDVVEIVLDSTTCIEAIQQRTKPGYYGVNVLGLPSSPADTDGDGYEDDTDECRTAQEDFDGFEDVDGCPDCDNDQDGIPDADVWVLHEWGPGWANRDQTGDVDCRNEPEDVDGDRDEDGCPDE
jgi:hypothetical protein